MCHSVAYGFELLKFLILPTELPGNASEKEYHYNLERSFAEAQSSLMVIWGVWKVPQYTREKSAMIYRKCISEGLTKGRDLRTMALIAIWLACEEHGITRDLKQIATDMEIGAQLEAHVKAVRRTLYKSKPQERVIFYLKACIEDLALPEDVKNKANEILERVLAKKLELGKHPAVVAGAIVYLAGLGNNDATSQESIARTLNISERSIRRICREMMNSTN